MNQLLKAIGHGIVTHKTDIFMGFGLASGIGCVVTTVIQTIKACDIIETANSEMDLIDGG